MARSIQRGKERSQKRKAKVAEKNGDKKEEQDKIAIEDQNNSPSEAEEPQVTSESDEEFEGFSDTEDNTTQHKVKKLNPKLKHGDVQSGKVGGEENSKDNQYSSIIYVGRLPHGFHEKELSRYFSQFGDLKEVRLARNKKTGNSRHYGFVDFVNRDDAKVAQETMNNYLLMGHILKVNLMPKGAKIEKLYKHRPKAFRVTRIKKTKDELTARSKKNMERRFAKLEEAGIDFKWVE